MIFIISIWKSLVLTCSWIMADTSAGDEQIVAKFGAVCSWLSSTTYFCSKGPSGGKKIWFIELENLQPSNIWNWILFWWNFKILEAESCSKNHTLQSNSLSFQEHKQMIVRNQMIAEIVGEILFLQFNISTCDNSHEQSTSTNCRTSENSPQRSMSTKCMTRKAASSKLAIRDHCHNNPESPCMKSHKRWNKGIKWKKYHAAMAGTLTCHIWEIDVWNLFLEGTWLIIKLAIHQVKKKLLQELLLLLI